jgi:catechol 2,3-dioxygenase-like lactoylglutathione lyase family enzyme
MKVVRDLNDRARLVGMNHVALEVGNIKEALSFYGSLFEFSLRGRSAKMARRAASMWLTPVKSAQPPKTMSRVRADVLGKKRRTPPATRLTIATF